jgi:hypothetical protein
LPSLFYLLPLYPKPAIRATQPDRRGRLGGITQPATTDHDYDLRSRGPAHLGITALDTSRLKRNSASIQGRESYWIFKLPVHLFDHVLHTLKSPKHCILVQLIAKTKQSTGLPNAFIIILAIHVSFHLGRSNV